MFFSTGTMPRAFDAFLPLRHHNPGGHRIVRARHERDQLLADARVRREASVEVDQDPAAGR